MALNADQVQIGPSRVWLAVTNPATGNPPTKMAHTAGVPASGTEVGYTTGDTTFSKGQEVVDIDAEQANSPIISFITTEIVEVRFTAMERTFKALQSVFHNNTSVQDGAGIFVYGGGGANTLRTQSVFFSTLRPAQSGKYEWAVVYKAYSVTGYETSYRKNAASTYAVTLRGQIDSSRDLGDQLFQYQIEA